MKVAVEGCCHGQLDDIYDHVANLEKRNGYKVDLLLICGDFQAMRNHQDLNCMAVPPKHRKLGGFYRYYTGKKVAPIPTVVIGGNHEASNYMWELYHGGWLAPNIYFLGLAGCVQFGGVRIAGSSGIFSGTHYRMGHWETLPYDNGSMRSIYHTREYDIYRLAKLSKPDIFLSHDWPCKIWEHGDADGLLRCKPHFLSDMQTGRLGSPPLQSLLEHLRPPWWFAAHLHCRFEATVRHEDAIGSGCNPDEITIDDIDAAPAPPERSAKTTDNPDEIVLDDEIADVVVPEQLPPTRFIALDKCLPRRRFLEVVDIPIKAPAGSQPIITYDPEWLAITRAFHPYLSISREQRRLPDETQAKEMIRTELKWVKENVGDKEKQDGIREVSSCQVFGPTAPGPGSEGHRMKAQPPWYTNPQTVAFCDMLHLPNKVNPVPEVRSDAEVRSPSQSQAAPTMAREPNVGEPIGL